MQGTANRSLRRSVLPPVRWRTCPPHVMVQGLRVL